MKNYIDYEQITDFFDDYEKHGTIFVNYQKDIKFLSDLEEVLKKATKILDSLKHVDTDTINCSQELRRNISVISDKIKSLDQQSFKIHSANKSDLGNVMCQELYAAISRKQACLS